jgi:hypothetical protein
MWSSLKGPEEVGKYGADVRRIIEHIHNSSCMQVVWWKQRCVLECSS